MGYSRTKRQHIQIAEMRAKSPEGEMYCPACTLYKVIKTHFYANRSFTCKECQGAKPTELVADPVKLAIYNESIKGKPHKINRCYICWSIGLTINNHTNPVFENDPLNPKWICWHHALKYRFVGPKNRA